MRLLVKIVVIIISFLWTNIALAQYPVTTNITLIPPHTNQLSALHTSTSNKMMVTVLLNDDEEPSYQAKLRFKILGDGYTIETDPNYFPSPIILDYNIPLVLQGYELAEYFQPSNLIFQGLDQQLFLQTGRLPEGPFSICVEVYDYIRDFQLPVSNEACAFAYVEEHDPPVIITPIGIQQVHEPFTLEFTWQPMHIGAFPAQYNLFVFEKIPGLSANQILTSTAPLFTISTPALTHLHTAIDPPLDLDQPYLVVVQLEDLNGEAAIKNDGFSEVEEFILLTGTGGGGCTGGDPCDDNDPCTINDVYTEDCLCEGTPAGDSDNDTVCDPEDQCPGEDDTIDTNQNGIPDCIEVDCTEGNPCDDSNPCTENDMIDAECNCIGTPIVDCEFNACVLDWTPIPYECGSNNGNVDVDAMPLINYLEPLDTIIASDFLVVLKNVTINSDGTFTGIGYIAPEFFNQARINLEFENIKVDQGCRMVEGMMGVTGAGIQVISDSLAATIQEIVDILDQVDTVLETVEDVLEAINPVITEVLEIDEYFTDGWTSIKDGFDIITIEYPYINPSVIEGLEEAIECIKSNPANYQECSEQLAEALEDLKEALEAMFNATEQITFVKNPDAINGLDNVVYPGIENQYNKIKVAGEDYIVPWKSIKSGAATDLVDATMPDNKPFPDNIRFETNTKEAVPETDIDNFKELIVKGGTDGETHQVYPVEERGDSVFYAGKLNVVSYDELPLKVTVVPVNGANYPYDANNFIRTLDTIFGQAVIKPIVTMHPGINVSEFDDYLDDFSTGTFSNFSDEMNDIIDAFEDDNNNTIEPDGYYVFLLKYSDDPSLLGYMPKTKHFGFVVNGNHPSNDEGYYINTIAHELGHGAYNWAHTFEQFPGLEKQETDNLMDYDNGRHLCKYQWDQARDPGGGLTIFNNDDEGESTVVSFEELEPFKNIDPNNEDIDGTYTFIAPSGLPITLPKSTTFVEFNSGDEVGGPNGNCENFITYPIGTLRSFKCDDGVFVSTYSCSSQSFNGYDKTGSANDRYEDEITPLFTTLSDRYGIAGYPCWNGTKITFNVGKIDFPDLGIDRSLVSNDNYKAKGFIDELTLLADQNVQEAKEVEFAMRPEPSAEAMVFISKLWGQVGCGSDESFYLFTHADQITNYPGFFIVCNETFQDLTEAKIKQQSSKLYATASSLYRTKEDYEPGGYGDALSTISTEGIYEGKEHALWKQYNRSIYKDYYEYLRDNLNDQFWSTIKGNTDEQKAASELFLVLNIWKDNPCVFGGISWNNREFALRILAENLEFTEDNWYDKDLEEENIFNKLVSTTPNSERANLLNFFKTNPKLYLTVVDGLNDTWSLSHADSHGYEFFVSTLYKFSHDLAGFSFDVSGKEFPIHKDLYGHDYGNDMTAGTMTLGYSYEDKENFPVQVKQITSGPLSPFSTVVVTFKEATKFKLSNGSDEVEFKEGATVEMPIFFLDFVIRKYRDAQVELGARVTLDIVAIIAGVATGGMTTGAVMLARAGAVYGALDVFVAAEKFEYDITGYSELSDEFYKIWDGLGLVLGIGDLTLLVRQVGPKMVVRFSEAKQLFKSVFSNTDNTKVNNLEDALIVLKAELNEQALLTGSANPMYPKLINAIEHLELEIKSIQISKTIKFIDGSPATIDNFGFSVGENGKGTFSYLNTPIGQEFDLIVLGTQTGIKPAAADVIAVGGAAPANHTLLAKLENIVVDFDGAKKLRNVEVYHSSNGFKLKLISSVDNAIIQQYPGLIDFYNLFRDKNWLNKFDDFFQDATVASYFDNLPADARTAVKSYMNNSDVSINQLMRWSDEFSPTLSNFLTEIQKTGKFSDIMKEVDQLDNANFTRLMDAVDASKNVTNGLGKSLDNIDQHHIKSWLYLQGNGLSSIATDMGQLAIFQQYYSKAYTGFENWSKLTIQRHFDDVLGSSLVAQKCVDDPEMLKVWESLRAEIDDIDLIASDFPPSPTYWNKVEELESIIYNNPNLRETGGFSNTPSLQGYGVLKFSQFSPSPQTGFSGIFDVVTKRLFIYPSGATKYADGSAIPSSSLVSQYGGHAQIRSKMVEYFGDLSDDVARKQIVGFSLSYKKAGELEVKYNSWSCNGVYNRHHKNNLAVKDNQIPMEHRPALMDELNKEFNTKRGLNISFVDIPDLPLNQRLFTRFSHSQSLMDEIALLPNANYLLQAPIAAKIQAIGNPVKFFDDILASKGATDGLGNNLNKLTPEVVQAWKYIPNETAKNINRLEKVAEKMGDVIQLGEPKLINIAENILKINPPVSSTVVDNLAEITVYIKDIQTKFPHITTVYDDFIELTASARFKNVEDLRDFLQHASNRSGPTYKLEVDDALKLIREGKDVKMGYKAGTNANGNVIDIDVYDVTNNIAIECKQTTNNFDSNLGQIGKKFNDEGKLPTAIKETFAGLEGSLHCTKTSISGITDVTVRDDVLYKVLQYVQKPSNANNVIGLNQLSKLHIKIGNDIEYTFLRSEW